MTPAHWVYIAGTLLVVIAMIARKNVVVPSIVATLVLGWVAKGSVLDGIQTVFNSSVYAANSLFNIFLVIAVMVAMLKAVSATGADKLMVAPIQRLMHGPMIAYLVLIVATYLISTFFWPSPSIPLVGALLIPPAIRAGLSPMTAAMAVAISGQGMALAGDLVLQGAPKITSTAANIPIDAVLTKAGILTVIVGVVSMAIAYVMQRKEDTAFRASSLEERVRAAGLLAVNETAASSEVGFSKKVQLPEIKHKWLAGLVPLALVIVVIAMLSKGIKGGDATALLGGTGFVLLLVASFAHSKMKALESVSDFLVDGFVFAFRAMGPVIPIAGFFFLGGPDGAAAILGKGTPGYLFDAAVTLGHSLHSGVIASFGILLLGILTGIDGSGFAGLPLVGATAGALGGGDVNTIGTLGALGQIGAVWTGGGTLVAWSTLVAVAGISGFNAMELAKKNFLPVIIGMIVATLFSLIFW
ncbi:MAG: hypothetical protein ACXVDB_07190 [Tumebacillaceae bacterium]